MEKYVEMQQSTYTDLSLKSSRELIYRNKGDLVVESGPSLNRSHLERSYPVSSTLELPV